MNQLKNLKVALEGWKQVPFDKVVPGLRAWREDEDGEDTTVEHCGTLHCFGGWLCTQPYFQKLGLFASTFGAPELGHIGPFAVSQALFGADMFEPVSFLERAKYGAQNMFTQETAWRTVYDRLEDRIEELTNHG